MKTAVVAFISPAGSTRHVAHVIAHALKERSIDVHQLDLSITKDPSRFMDKLQAGGEACLFVGSPVYRDMAVPPVMRFLESLPADTGLPAVPFVTWGGANSGIALWQMGQALDRKGFGIIGAAKVLGVHSMMWPSDDPLGKGHPDADDDREIRDLVDTVVSRMQRDADAFPRVSLDYQPETVSAEIKPNLAQPWMIVPKTVNEDNCTQCAICREVCPVDAVTLNPFPAFGETCISCFNCVRECPESAIDSPLELEQLDTKIRKKAVKFNEQPLTQIFV
jgi:ferredoxin